MLAEPFISLHTKTPTFSGTLFVDLFVGVSPFSTFYGYLGVTFFCLSIFAL